MLSSNQIIPYIWPFTHCIRIDSHQEEPIKYMEAPILYIWPFRLSLISSIIFKFPYCIILYPKTEFLLQEPCACLASPGLIQSWTGPECLLLSFSWTRQRSEWNPVSTCLHVALGGQRAVVGLLLMLWHVAKVSWILYLVDCFRVQDQSVLKSWLAGPHPVHSCCFKHGAVGDDAFMGHFPKSVGHPNWYCIQPFGGWPCPRNALLGACVNASNTQTTPYFWAWSTKECGLNIPSNGIKQPMKFVGTTHLDCSGKKIPLSTSVGSLLSPPSSGPLPKVWEPEVYVQYLSCS